MDCYYKNKYWRSYWKMAVVKKCQVICFTKTRKLIGKVLQLILLYLLEFPFHYQWARYPGRPALYVSTMTEHEIVTVNFDTMFSLRESLSKIHNVISSLSKGQVASAPFWFGFDITVFRSRLDCYTLLQ